MLIRKELIIIIGIVTLYRICCKVGLSTYEKTHGTEIKDGMYIKSNGSLSPIQEFICEKLNLMYSMRFLSPGTDAHYSLIVIDDEENERNLKIESTRDYNKDVAYIKPSTEEKKEKATEIHLTEQKNEETAEIPTEKKNEEKKKKTTYFEDYHQTLIEMFPSSTGFLSIYTSRNDSFIKFLHLEHVSKHKIHILACLFLLAEGVDIPLKLEGSKTSPMLVLKEIIVKSEEENKTEDLKESKPEIKKKNKKRKLKESKTESKKENEESGEKKNIFSLSMKYRPDSRKNENSKEKKKAVPQTRAANVINFFIGNKTNPDIREGGEYAEPRTYEEFKTGKFLNNARWLIQYYIFEYLDSEEKIIELAKEVYSMLKECIEQKEKEGSNEDVEYLKSIVDKCFVKSSGANTIKAKHRIDILTTIYKESPLVNVFPFSGDIDISKYRSISSYNRKEDSFNVGKKYSDCVEAGLLSLFCCLAYDSKSKEYNIDHMGEVSLELKRFFDTHNKQLETDTYEMHMEWSKVVADLENKNIRYLKENRNELAPGIINMLYVIAEITGRYSDEEESFKELNTLLEREDNVNQSELFTKVELYTEELILSLSKKYTAEEDSELPSREIKIDILNMSKCPNLNGQTELFGEVVITYSYLNLEGGIKLIHTIEHLQATSFPSRINTLTNEKKKEIINNKNSIENESEKTLTDFLLMQLVDKLMEGNSFISNYYKENIKISRENNYFYPIEKFFLYNTFKSAEYKIYIIRYIRECLLEHSLEETDPWSRLLSNMIGSLPLEDLNTVRDVFFNPLYRAGFYKGFCTKVNIPITIVDRNILSYSAGVYYEQYIYNNNFFNRHLEFLKAHLLTKSDRGNFFAAIVCQIDSGSNTHFLSLLTHGITSIKPLLEIEAFLNSIDRDLPEYETVIKANDIWLVWLNMSFRSDVFNKITTILFDKIVIDEDFITINETKYEYTDENIKNTISKFEKSKFPQTVKNHVLNLIKKDLEYAKKLNYLIKKYEVFLVRDVPTPRKPAVNEVIVN
ncbi:hypothetical protein NEPAR04_2240 [Nematocida parisii]|nr:hypothetical protein NEPAR03_2220 [Nematocida parisii]KAI5131250.1 hypothetical protein NEPAR08_2403 [Nematocida parisii]KAI5144822.1 hypothetical protein NEPAR04_2240 [Nematocida parisii]